MTSDNKAKGIAALARWTGDLVPTGGDDLDTLRFLLANEAVDLDGDGEPDAPALAGVERFVTDDLPEASRAVLAEGPVRAVPRVPPLLALARGEGLVRSALEAITLGPFRDRLGILRWFDFYRPAARLQVLEPGDPVPVLVLTSARTPFFGRLAIDLEPGTVWIRARKLDAAAPADLFVSVRVRDGKLALTAAPAESGGRITLSGPLGGQLELALAPAPGGPGACGGPEIELPERIVVRWSATGVTGELTGGAVRAFGTRHECSGSARFAFDGLLRTIVAETSVRPAELDASAVASPLGELRGRATIDSGGLALPGFTTAAPATLPEAAPGGTFVMRSASGLTAQLQVAGELRLPGTLWLFAAGSFSVVAPAAVRPPALERVARLRLYQTARSEHRTALALDVGGPGLFALGWADESGACVHSALFGARAAAAFDRPLDVVGRPLEVAPSGALCWLQHRAGATAVILLGTTWTALREPVSIAIENAVLRVHRTRLRGIVGRLAGDGDLDDGAAYLDLDLGGWAPTLPDPYVSNARPAFRQRDGGTTVIAALAWTAGGRAALGFEGALRDPALAAPPDTPPPPLAPEREQLGWRLPSQTRDGTPNRSRKERVARAAAAAEVAERLAREAGQAEERNQALLQRLRGAFDEIAPRVRGPLFLDVSTNRHLIGVQVGLGGERVAAAASGVPALRLAGMRVLSPLANVRVFTVPQVQWEPVRTLDKDQDPVTLGMFPTPLASRDDGGATLIGARSSRLAPVIPDLALTDMVDEQTRGLPMAVATTLPFGLAAVIALRTPSDPGPPDRVGFVRPTFAHGGGLEGAHQLALVAGGPSIPGGPSPSFEGRTAQLLNGVDLATGAPLGISVLGATLGPDSSVEAMFNREFSDSRPRVPVTRLDLSGYGASTFSDWANPQGAFAEATKVRFQLMVGRTALEIIKFASIIYPWAIRVTRAVTIERTGGGGVIRRDTGWQASSGGVFDFRYLEAVGDPPTGYTPRPNPFTFHPGLVQALHGVARIRPAPGAAVSLPGGGEVAPVLFDADVYLEGLPGGGATRTEGMLGFLHLAPVGRIISTGDLVAMLRTEGGVGGPVDARVEVGGSSFHVRALRVEAVPTADGSAIACAVRGAPELRSSGAWSAVRMPGPTNTTEPPEAVPLYDGVPLIQAGRARTLAAGDPAGDRVQRDTGTIGPYRFAEPEDLLRPATPDVDVAFLQTTPTHSFAFRRPYIERGRGRIESTLAPALADFFARTAFRAPFPPLDAAIALADRPYWLRLGAGGTLRLEPSVALPAPRGPLVLSSGPDANRRLFYDDTTLELSIDATQWSLSMPRLRMWADLPSMSELIGMRMSLVGGSAIRSQIRDVESLYHDVLETALTFVPGFTGRPPVDAIDLAASNLKLQWKIAAVFAVKIKIVPKILELKIYGGFDFTGVQDDAVQPAPLPPGSGPVVTGGGGFDYGTFGLKAGFELRGKTPGGPYFFVYGLVGEVGGKFFLGDKSNALIPEDARKDKLVLTFKLYLGVGYGANVGPFEASVFVAAGPVLVIEGGTVKIGGLLLFEAKADVTIVKVRVFAEFQCLYFKKSLPAGPKDYLQFSGELGINIEIALIFSIKISVTVIGEKAI